MLYVHSGFYGKHYDLVCNSGLLMPGNTNKKSQAEKLPGLT